MSAYLTRPVFAMAQLGLMQLSLEIGLVHHRGLGTEVQLDNGIYLGPFLHLATGLYLPIGFAEVLQPQGLADPVGLFQSCALQGHPTEVPAPTWGCAYLAHTVTYRHGVCYSLLRVIHAHNTSGILPELPVSYLLTHTPSSQWDFEFDISGGLPDPAPATCWALT